MKPVGMLSIDVGYQAVEKRIRRSSVWIAFFCCSVGDVDLFISGQWNGLYIYINNGVNSKKIVRH